MKKVATYAHYALLCAVFLSSNIAHAKYNGEERGRPVMPAAVNATFQQECGSCHVAYAPGLLPAASWTKIMGGLDKHFGVDASLSAAENKAVTDFLVKNASNRWTASTAPLRITESVWFKSKHDSHEINPAVWKRPAVKGAFNCSACHTTSDKGDFSERNIRIPK